MTSDTINLVENTYAQTGNSTKNDEMGMREMQARAYKKRNSQYLLIKSPPASGKSRALMFIALDKLINQGREKIIVAVPEKSIGASFSNTKLTDFGFFSDWEVELKNNLCTGTGDDKSKVKSFVKFMESKDKIMICTHATLRYAFEKVNPSDFNNCVLAIDEFHHISVDNDSRLGDLLRRVMSDSDVHIIAMTGSYFRGDTVPILNPEDETKFDKVTYTYYEQLNGYTYLKTLGIGYNFYTGNYLEDKTLNAILDSNKKTIVHIPNVNSKESTLRGKREEVHQIMDIIGTYQSHDNETGIDYIKTNDGRLLKIANLVDDEPNHRTKLDNYLAEKARTDINGIDIIIALGKAKEGFDWPFCEQALTIGYRSSLTEIVQIIGRCTRDSYNKTHTQFINLIAQPNGTNEDIQVSVNNMLKAITASLLMEQVLAPSFTFKPRETPTDPREPGTILIRGLKKPTTDRVRQILTTELEDLTAAVLQDTQVQRASANNIGGEYMKHLESKIIRERIPGLTEEEIEITRQYLASNLAFKTAKVTTDERGNKFITMANKFINLDDLNIDLIDSINPFQHAFEVISKKIGADTFRIIQDTIAGSRIDMDDEDALVLVPKIKLFRLNHNGKYPSLYSEDPEEKLLAQAQAYLTRRRADYESQKAKEN